ncbi:MAG: hypothetical protein LBJ76_02665 [Candidatus Accumulibacter sp.]|jgi:hypothetical protein|nr:hypothetical protein [Accumulibacter sp.]
MRRVIPLLIFLFTGCAELEAIDKALKDVAGAPSATPQESSLDAIEVGRAKGVPRGFRFRLTITPDSGRDINYRDRMTMKGSFTYTNSCRPLSIHFAVYDAKANPLKLSTFDRIVFGRYEAKSDGTVNFTFPLENARKASAKSAKITEVECVQQCLRIGGKTACSG